MKVCICDDARQPSDLYVLGHHHLDGTDAVTMGFRVTGCDPTPQPSSYSRGRHRACSALAIGYMQIVGVIINEAPNFDQSRSFPRRPARDCLLNIPDIGNASHWSELATCILYLQLAATTLISPNLAEKRAKTAVSFSPIMFCRFPIPLQPSSGVYLHTYGRGADTVLEQCYGCLFSRLGGTDHPVDRRTPEHRLRRVENQSQTRG